ncbi:hypothetical protein [Pseudonocardia sp.]|uniref:hypothetical protein n=1 Tax=Pseudonocardia sp. TaxID=60912 RepID=UPI00263766CE|nr:hypothetical protein [Pseudonocardia sp.]MCW2716695.1 hypothetical protein [Pseudonocardia sp.]
MTDLPTDPASAPAQRRPAPAPIAPDRPVVDGTATSSDQLRAEVEQESGECRAQVEELREEIAGTATELMTRLNVPARVGANGRASLARFRHGPWGALRSPAVAVGAALLVLTVVRRLRRGGGR